MKKSLAAAIIAACSLVAATPSLAYNLDLVPSASHIFVGGNVTVDIVVSGLTAPLPGGPAEVVSAFDLSIKYAPAVLSTGAISYSLMLGDPSLFEVLQGTPTVGGGLVGLTAMSLLPDDPDFILGINGLSGIQQGADAVLLATIGFTGISDGGVLLAFDNFNPTTDLIGRSYQNFPQSLNPIAGTACVLVGNATTCGQGGTVPEPATPALVLGALACLASFCRRKGCAREGFKVQMI